ncbi:MAG: HD domain-containing protein [Heliomarina sp.]|uniref:HD domain-containing protein n=1 Tax=Heliomarina sp. TaxID=2917556 RepID=UPI00405A1A4A
MKNRFFDPIYGPVVVDEQSMSLMLSPEIQRLRYVRMCNINSLLISGASEPSRFEHIVGVYHLANVWADAHEVHAAKRDVLRAAAVLHDLQTGPFGHSMEYILDDNKIEGDFNHEDINAGKRSSYLQDLTQGVSFSGAPFKSSEILGSNWDDVVEIIKGRGAFGPLVSAEIDIDNIDNVVRLACHVGVTSQSDARSIAQGLASDIEIGEQGASVGKSGVELVMRWQDVREKLYKLLLWDWAEFSAKAMLTRVMEDAVALGKLSSDRWILTDDALISYLSQSLTGEGGATKEILSRLVRGALYDPVSLLRMSGTANYDGISNLKRKREIEVALAEAAGCSCIFHAIKDRAKTNRAINIYNRATMKSEVIGRSSNETLIGVFSAKELSKAAKRRVRVLLQEILGELPGDEHVLPLPDPIEDIYGEPLVPESQLDLFQ